MSSFINYNGVTILVSRTNKGTYFLTPNELIRLGGCSASGFYFKWKEIKHRFNDPVDIINMKYGHSKYVFTLDGAIKFLYSFRSPNDGLISIIKKFREDQKVEEQDDIPPIEIKIKPKKAIDDMNKKLDEIITLLKRPTLTDILIKVLQELNNGRTNL